MSSAWQRVQIIEMRVAATLFFILFALAAHAIDSSQFEVLFTHRTEPAVFAVSATANPGDIVNLQGKNFTRQIPYVWGESTNQLISTVPISADDGSITFQIRADMPQDAYDVYLGTAKKSINIPEVWYWEFPEIATGDSITLYGRNFSLSASVPTASVTDNLGNNQAATVTAYDANSITITMPTVVAARTYTATVNNSYASGTSTDLTTGRAGGGSDTFSLGVPWGRDYATTQYDVTTSTHFAHADKTGATDSTSALNACISYVYGVGGGICYFPAGTYTLASAASGIGLTMATGVVLQGASAASVTVNYGPTGAIGGGYYYFALYYGASTTLSGIADMTWNNVDTLSQDVNPWTIQGSTSDSKLFIQRVVWHNGTGPALNTNGTDRLAIENSTIDNVSNTQGAGGGCSAYINGDGTLSLDGVTHFYFLNNSITNIDGQSNFLSMSHAVMQGNTFNRSATDKLQATSGNLACLGITGNDLMHAGDYGMRQQGRQTGTDFAQYVMIQNNKYVVTDGFLRVNHNDGETDDSESNANGNFNSVGTTTGSAPLTITGTPEGGSWNWASGYIVAVTSGAGEGQWRFTTGLSTNTFTVSKPWDILPAVGDTFSVFLAQQYVIYRNNFATGNPSGLIFYRGGYFNNIITNNVLRDNGGVYQYGFQDPLNQGGGGPSVGNSRNLEITANTFIDTMNQWPSWISQQDAIVSPQYFFSRWSDGFIARGNVVTGGAATPGNLYPEGLSAANQYVDGSGNYLPGSNLTLNGIYGDIWQNNITNTVTNAYNIGTGDKATTIWNAQGGVTNVSDTNFGFGALAGSIGTVTKSDSAPFITPVNDVAPAIWTLGSAPQAGQINVVSIGKWRLNPASCTVQWKLSGTNIAGATGWSYISVAGDLGGTYTAAVTCTNTAGSATATSAASPVIIAASAATPVPLGIPRMGTTAPVSGTAITVGSLGYWTGAPTSQTCEWLDNGVAISGATSCSTYTPVSGDVGQALSLAVSSVNAGGTSAYFASRSYPVTGTAVTLPNWYTAGNPTPAYTCGTVYFVNVSGGNDSRSAATAQTLSTPWATIAHAASVVGSSGANVCIKVVAGNYPQTSSLVVSAAGNLNSPTGYVTFQSVNSSGVYTPAVDSAQGVHAGSAARIYSNSGSIYSLLALGGNYQVWDGFEIDGNSGQNGGPCFDSEFATGTWGHHLVLQNNLVHDCGGGGFQLNGTEYLWVYNNVIHDNATTNGFAMSGISIFEASLVSTHIAFTPNAADSALPFHIIIAQNLIWHNYEGPSISGGAHTDGNSVIIDSDNHATPAYVFPILVYGNAAMFNGGGCVQLDWSSYVTVANNSCYSDYLDLANTGTARSELNEFGSSTSTDPSHNTWVNNIAQNVTSGSGINTGSGSLSNNVPVLIDSNDTGVPCCDTYTTNIGYPSFSYNASAYESFAQGSGFPVVTKSDPTYTTLGSLPGSSTNTIPSNLRLQAGSPGIGAATAEIYIPSNVTNLGAYGPGALQ